jgi:hypothetical protein
MSDEQVSKLKSVGVKYIVFLLVTLILPFPWIYETYGIFTVFISSSVFICLWSTQVYLNHKKDRLAETAYEYYRESQPSIMAEGTFSLWPTAKLKKAVEKYKKNDGSIINWPLDSDTKDVTENTKHQIRRFFPDIKMFGIDLRLDSFAYYGGVLTRVLEKEENGTKQRCLQYLFVFTQQGGVLGFIWWPIVLSSIGFSLYYLSWFVVVLIFLPLCIYGADYSRHFRGLSQFVLAQVLPFVLLVIVYFFPNMGYLIFMTAATIALILTTTVFPVLYRRGFRGISHPMDYLPVFIWIEKQGDEEPERWEIISACWDTWHYNTRIVERRDLQKYLRDESTLCLVMDNLWHSVDLGGPYDSKSSRVIMFSRILLILSPYIILFSYGLLEIGWFVIVSYSVVGALLVAANGPFSFADIQSSTLSPKMLAYFLPEYLSVASDAEKFEQLGMRFHETYLKIGVLSDDVEEGNLITLWNLREERKYDGTTYQDDAPSLKIITKMQDPFKYLDKNRFTSFRDDSLDLYAEIKSLRDEIADSC